MLAEAVPPSPASRRRLSSLRWRLGLGVPLLVLFTVVGVEFGTHGLEVLARPAGVTRSLLLSAVLSLVLLLWIERALMRPLRQLVAGCEAIESQPAVLDTPVEAPVAAPLGDWAPELERIGLTLWRARGSLSRQDQDVQRLRRELAQQRDALDHARGQIEHQQRELASLARTDALTGLANQRAFDESLRREFKRAQRLRGLLSLAILDLDQFKQFNQTHGLAAGDEALRRVAALLSERFKRDTDLVARLGGEEFVALLPGVGMAEAQGVLESLRDDLRSLRLPHGQGDLTISIGLAAASPAHPYLSPQALMQAADEALYMAKHSGRDRLSLAA